MRSVHTVPVAGVVLLTLLSGCKQRTNQAPAANPAMQQLAAPGPAPHARARPSVPPPPFRVFHHDASSVTLVTKENASDDEIAAIVWQLRDAAHNHTFDKLGIPQKLVDARDPIIWFHIYRGAKCASEKYTSGTLPCGAAYHAAGDYTLGGFHNKDHDEGVLLKNENHQTELWNPDAPYNSAH